jgi:hypothetical protein
MYNHPIWCKSIAYILGEILVRGTYLLKTGTLRFRDLHHGFAPLEQKGGFDLPLDLDVTFRLLIDTFLVRIDILVAKKYRIK